MFGEVAINPIKRNLYDKPQLRNTKLAERLRELRAFQGWRSAFAARHFGDDDNAKYVCLSEENVPEAWDQAIRHNYRRS